MVRPTQGDFSVGNGVDRGGLEGAVNLPLKLNCHFIERLLILSET